MIAREVLDYLAETGITLERNGERLIARPTPALTEDGIFLLRRHKAEILAALDDGEVFWAHRPCDPRDDSTGTGWRTRRRLSDRFLAIGTRT